MFYPYRWTDLLKELSSVVSHKGLKYYQGVINKTYHGGNIGIDHHVICLIPEDATNNFLLSNFTIPESGTLKEVLDNETTKRDNTPLNGLGMTKGKYRGVSVMLKTGMEVAQYFTIFNYRPPIT